MTASTSRIRRHPRWPWRARWSWRCASASNAARTASPARLEMTPSRVAQVRGRGRSTGTSAMTRPGRADRTTTRSARKTASGMLWVTMTMVAPRRSQSPSSSAIEPVTGERIERPERLVQEQHAGFQGQGPGEGDPLGHATRQLGRQRVLETCQTNEVHQLRGHASRAQQMGGRQAPGDTRRCRWRSARAAAVAPGTPARHADRARPRVGHRPGPCLRRASTTRR